ncbi:MAG: TonB-dependent receptor, partial [Comamonas sp.]
RQTSRYGLPGHSHDFEGCHTHGDHLHCGSHDGHDHDEHDHEHADSEVPVVDMVSERLDMRGELRQPFAGVAAVRFRAGLTDYRHDEIEEGAIATTFKNKAHDARVEIEHQPIGGLRGVVGMQTTNRKFSAIGEEAYVQPTETRRNSLFLLEEYRWQDWRFEGALRHERQTAEALTSGLERKHSGTSAS